MALEDLRKNGMMAHLLDSLKAGKDIGHYGRLVFTMVARHFLSEEEVVHQLAQDRDFTEEQARELYTQVQQHDYNPPRREKIMEFQERQEFPICPDGGDPDSCNVYKDLQFPEHTYGHIAEYHHAKEEAGATK